MLAVLKNTPGQTAAAGKLRDAATGRGRNT